MLCELLKMPVLINFLMFLNFQNYLHFHGLAGRVGALNSHSLNDRELREAPS